ncbi:MAG: RNA polymerase sigma factor [Candidatus Hodarchaeota archaeon]
MPHKFHFGKIYDEYYQRIVQYLTRIVGPDDAEDITQDVFEKINRNLSEFRQDSKLSTWIYRIATNTAIDRMRAPSFRYFSEHTSIEDSKKIEDGNVWADHSKMRTDQTLIRKEMSECVKEFIDNLPPDYKAVIVLSELEGLANKEIAEILSISLDNVKVRLHRARAKLKTALNEGCDFYHNEQNALACDRKQVQILPKAPK